LPDDGSDGYQLTHCPHYAAQHPRRVRYLEHDGHRNRGASASRNLGSHAANGEYIAFLDADDVWLPRKLQQQVAILESHPEAGTVYGRGLWWYGWTGNPEDAKRDFMQDLGVQPDSLIRCPELLTLFLKNEDAVPSSFAIMVRREILERVGRSEEDWRSVYDDQVAFAKLALEAPVFVAGECWYRYRQHADSRCYLTFTAGQYHAVRLPFLVWLQDYLLKRGIKDEKVWEALKFELAPTCWACGDFEQGARYLNEALKDGPLGSREVIKLSKVLTQCALAFAGDGGLQFVRDLFEHIRPTGQMRRLRRRVIGLVNADLALRYRQAGLSSRAWHHAVGAVFHSPSLFHDRGLLRIALERLVGSGMVDRIRSR
jgi:glycosyltransferase involved in cell wall biosynthesis